MVARGRPVPGPRLDDLHLLHARHDLDGAFEEPVQSAAVTMESVTPSSTRGADDEAAVGLRNEIGSGPRIMP